MADLGSNLDWPKIPEVPVDFKPNARGALEAEIFVDLGILGKWEIGKLQIDQPDPVAEKKEMADDVAEVQRAFERLLMRIAASAMVERGEGCFPVIGWYAHRLVEEHGEEKANEMLDGQLAELFKYRKEGIGLHEI